jgi:phosphatidyl-myo-inositol alpha-mannosyltransferase
MRVGLVCPYSWDVPGGVQVHIRDLAETLIGLGHEVSVLAPADEEADLPPYVVPAGRAYALPYNGSVARLLFGPVSSARVRRWVREGDFDVLHIHEPIAPSVGLIAAWAASGPLVGTFHMSSERSRALLATSRILQQALEKLSARIAVSEYARATMEAHVGGMATVIPNGVQVDVFAKSDPLPGWADGRPAIGFLGRMDEPRKGLPVLVEALPLIVERHPDVRVLLVGPGDPEEALDGLPDRYRDHVEIAGRVSEADKIRAYHSVDVFVAPNTGGESFGIVLLEAMASGTPVVASDLAAFREVARDAAVLTRVGDVASVADAVNNLLADPADRSRRSERGREIVARYDWSRVAVEVLEVYDIARANGDKVTEDARGQTLGRLSKLTRLGDTT